MKNIQLTIPEQIVNENFEIELNSGRLERAFKEFQLDDMVATVRQLDETITAFNKVKTPETNRLKLLEVYYKAFRNMLQGYDEMRIAQLKISENQRLKLSNDIMWLYIKLSIGYKIIVKDYVDSGIQSKQPDYLLTSTFRAIETMVVSLIYAYRFKLETPPLTYLELHQLYAFAEFHELSVKPIKAENGYAKKPTIFSFYTLALIFISIEPRQYEPYMLEVLLLALQPFSFNCRISPTFTPSDNSFIYKINLNENQRPAFIVDNELDGVNEWTRYLDIENFIAEINVWISNNEDSKNTMFIEHELELFPIVITRLKVSQNKSKLRLAENNSVPLDNEVVQIVVGLGALESLLIMHSVDFTLRLNYRISEWMLQSESPAGCNLASNINIINEKLSLGELVAIVNGGDNNDESISLLKIAQICSLQQLEQGILLIGLEHLSRSATPLIYMMISGEAATADATRSNGICLTHDDDKGSGSIMVVNRKHFNESQQYLVKTQERVSTVEVTKLIQQSLMYSFFNFKILQEDRNNLSSTKNIVNLAV